MDVGSNSVLLLVAEQAQEGWRTVLETSAVTGLGAGTKATGRIARDGAEATLAALREAFGSARAAGAVSTLAAGTMALRIASNAPQFLAESSAQGTPVAVLSGEEEASLGLESAARDPLWRGVPRLTVVDPGGHSTEVATLDRRGGSCSVLLRKSVPAGALGAREGLDDPESPGPRDRLRLCEAVDEAVGLCYLPGACGEVVALGATATNLVCIRDGLAEWNPDKVHGARLGYEEVSLLASRLCGLTEEARRRLVGLEPGRERTIHTGALVLERFLFAVRAESAWVSVRGWRHALLEDSDLYACILARASG